MLVGSGHCDICDEPFFSDGSVEFLFFIGPVQEVVVRQNRPWKGSRTGSAVFLYSCFYSVLWSLPFPNVDPELWAICDGWVVGGRAGGAQRGGDRTPACSATYYFHAPSINLLPGRRQEARRPFPPRRFACAPAPLLLSFFFFLSSERPICASRPSLFVLSSSVQHLPTGTGLQGDKLRRSTQVPVRHSTGPWLVFFLDFFFLSFFESTFTKSTTRSQQSTTTPFRVYLLKQHRLAQVLPRGSTGPVPAHLRTPAPTARARTAAKNGPTIQHTSWASAVHLQRRLHVLPARRPRRRTGECLQPFGDQPLFSPPLPAAAAAATTTSSSSSPVCWSGPRATSSGPPGPGSTRGRGGGCECRQ